MIGCGVRLILVQPQLSVAPDHDNTAALEACLAGSHIEPQGDDVLVLPEHFHWAAIAAATKRKCRPLPGVWAAP